MHNQKTPYCPVILINNHKLVEKAYCNEFGEEGFVAFLATGREGSGKTSYALWLGYLVYKDWDTVLKHLYFDPIPALKSFEKAVDRGERLKYVIFDDAGLWISKYRTYDENVKAFIEFYNVIRTLTASIMLTSPSDEIQRMLREKAWIRMIVEPLTYAVAAKYEIPLEIYGIDPKKQPLSIAKVYELNISPMLERYVTKRNVEIFPRHYPVKEKYDEKRRQAVKKKLIYLREVFERKENMNVLKKYAAWVLVKLQGYSIREAAKILRSSRSNVHRWVKWADDVVSTH